MDNILHIITTLDVGGTERMLEKVIRFRISHEHFVICLKGEGKIGKTIEDLGVKVVYLHLENPIRFLYLPFFLIKVIFTFKPKLVNAWMYQACLLSLFFKLFGHTIIWNIRNNNIRRKYNSWLTVCIAKCLIPFSSFCKKIIYNSYAAENTHSTIGYSRNNTTIIPNSIDCNVYQPKNKQYLFSEYSQIKPKKLIGFISRYNSHKDPHCFLEAVKIFIQKNKDTVFLCFGEGLDPSNLKWQRHIEKHNLKNYIYSFGTTQNILHWYSEFDFTTLSSVSESFPNTIVESLACGIPVVATDVGDISKILFEIGIIVPPKRPKELAEAWHKMASLNNQNILELSKACRQKALEKYDVKLTMNQYYKNLDN